MRLVSHPSKLPSSLGQEGACDQNYVNVVQARNSHLSNTPGPVKDLRSEFLQQSLRTLAHELFILWKHNSTWSPFAQLLYSQCTRSSLARYTPTLWSAKTRPHLAWPANRSSCSTSATDGVSPSAPHAPDNSSNDVAAARAAAHDNMEPHLNLQACSTRLLMRRVSSQAFDRKLQVSYDHRPPTSVAITTRRTRRWTPYQLWVCAFFPLPRRIKSNSVSFHGVSPGTAIRTKRTHQCRLRVGPFKKEKAIRDLESAPNRDHEP